MSLDAAAAPRRRLICGLREPSRRARANVPTDLVSHETMECIVHNG